MLPNCRRGSFFEGLATHSSFLFAGGGGMEEGVEGVAVMDNLSNADGWLGYRDWMVRATRLRL